jgi:plasmid maintenance system killer protein
MTVPAWKVGRIVSFLQDMADENELRTVPGWKAHHLTGDRKGTWSLFVTRNWRITFRIDQTEIEIIEPCLSGCYPYLLHMVVLPFHK